MYVEEAVAQKAVEETGFGAFNLKIMTVGALIYLNCAFSITSVGFVIPTAACDFEMTTIEKGRINAAPMLGMLVGSGVWGYVADLKGRRTALLSCLFLQFAADFLASVIPSYSVFVFLKVFSGIGVSGQLSTVFPYLGEFQPVKRRHQILSWMEFFWAVGVIVVAFLAWAIIPMTFHSTYWHYISFRSWNLFVLLNSLPALLVGVWLLMLPETPKFLAESAQIDTLIAVLSRMFMENTGRPAEEYQEKLAAHLCPTVRCLVDPLALNREKREKLTLTVREKFREMLESSKAQVKFLMRKPYPKRLCISGTIMFCMTSTYYSLMTWFPELFQRFAAFEQSAPGSSASVCTVSQKLAFYNGTDLLLEDSADDPFGCSSQIDTSVYVNSAWLGVACIPCAVLLPLTVNKVGYRIYLLFTSTISTIVTVAFYYVETSQQNLILSCIFEAFTSLNVSVLFCLLVDLFPTNLRVMATAMTQFIGRLGSLFGNTIFGYLIDDYCDVLIVIMAAQLFIASGMCWAAPTKDKLRRIQGHPKAEKKGNNPT